MAMLPGGSEYFAADLGVRQERRGGCGEQGRASTVHGIRFLAAGRRTVLREDQARIRAKLSGPIAGGGQGSSRWALNSSTKATIAFDWQRAAKVESRVAKGAYLASRLFKKSARSHIVRMFPV